MRGYEYIGRGSAKFWEIEDGFVLPAAWVRKAEPFRGMRPAPKLEIDVAATRSLVEARRQQAATLVRKLFGHPSSDPELVHRARLHQSRRQDDPLGAAVLLAAMLSAGRLVGERIDPAVLVADDLVLAHGVPFAAETCAHLADIVPPHQHSRADGRTQSWLRRREQGDSELPGTIGVLTRLRAHLAAAPDAAYAEAIERLAALRDRPPLVRIATSYLAPTELAWVRDAIAALPGVQSLRHVPPMLLASATTPADVAAVLAVTGTGSSATTLGCSGRSRPTSARAPPARWSRSSTRTSTPRRPSCCWVCSGNSPPTRRSPLSSTASTGSTCSPRSSRPWAATPCGPPACWRPGCTARTRRLGRARSCCAATLCPIRSWSSVRTSSVWTPPLRWRPSAGPRPPFRSPTPPSCPPSSSPRRGRSASGPRSRPSWPA